MKLKKVFLLLSLIYLTGCIQSAGLIGPAITVATTGNIYQAGLSYSSNKIIKKETGKSTSEHITELISSKKNKKKKPEIIEEDFIVLVKTQIKKTRKIIFSNTD